MNDKEIVVLIDINNLVEVNPYIQDILFYLVKREIKISLPHVNILNKSNINIDVFYKKYINDVDTDEYSVFIRVMKHMYNMLLYVCYKLDGVLDCVYKQKYNYFVLHLKERG